MITPEREATQYLNIQPTTIAYPMAIANDPITGINPIIVPPRI